MVKLVYTYALGAYTARCAGSSPVPGTIDKTPKYGVIFILRISFLVYNDKQDGENRKIFESVDGWECF